MNIKTTLAFAALAIASSQTFASPAYTPVYTFNFSSTTSPGSDYYDGFIMKSSAPQTFSQDVGLVLTSDTKVVSTTFDFDTVDLTPAEIAAGIKPGNTLITDGSVTLWEVGGASAIYTYTFGGLTAGTHTFTDLSAGSYFFVVSGDVAPGYYGTYEIDASVSAGIPPASAVPEPASSALLLAGVGLMGFMGLRRKQK